MWHLFNQMQITFRNIWRGDLSMYTPNVLCTAECAKCHISVGMLSPCGLGFQQLDLDCYAYSVERSK